MQRGKGWMTVQQSFLMMVPRVGLEPTLKGF